MYADSAGVSGFMSFAALRTMADSGLPWTSSMTRKYGSPEDFATFLAAETRRWADVAKAANVSVD